MGMSSLTTSGFPDPSSTGNGSRDSRISLTAPGSSVVVGPMIGHSGNGNDCLNPTLLGKYVDREPNTQTTNPLSRWPLLANDSLGGLGGTAGDLGIQQQSVFGGPGGQVIVDVNRSGGGSVAAVNGNGNNANAQRNLTLLGDGAQSLPSLKDSGLLDSWGSRATIAVDTQKQASNGSPQQQQQKQQQSLTVLPRTSSSISMALPSTSQHYTPHHQDVGDLRSTTTLGMPVGMSWLANE